MNGHPDNCTIGRMYCEGDYVYVIIEPLIRRTMITLDDFVSHAYSFRAQRRPRSSAAQNLFHITARYPQSILRRWHVLA